MSTLSRIRYDAVPASAPETADAPTVSRDVVLFNKARAGDRSAYGQIVQMYQDRLFNGILRIVGDPDDARDIVQEVFTRGLVKLDSFRGEASPYTWLFRIGMNLAISQLRRSPRTRVFSLDAVSGNGSRDEGKSGLLERLIHRGAGPQEQLENRERHQKVLEALGRLDAEYRAVLVMRDIEGFDYQQMADVLGLPLGTLKSRLFRARLALRDELLPYLQDGGES